MGRMSFDDVLNVDYQSRFLKYIKKLENGCWYWVGKSGNWSDKYYGSVSNNGKSLSAHRFSWMYNNNSDIPKGLFVCHSCDNKPCVNPYHLFLGTLQENTADAKSKGILANGERSARSKLTEDDVLRIFDMYKQGQTVREIAQHFGVNRDNVRYILLGKTWSHITKGLQIESTRRFRKLHNLQVGKSYLTIAGQQRTIVNIDGNDVYYTKNGGQKLYKCTQHTFKYYADNALQQLRS